jgi:hypothetical protein
MAITDLLNLFELMHSEDTPRILSVRSSLFSETRRVTSEPVVSTRRVTKKMMSHFIGSLLVSMFSSANMAEIGCSEVAMRYLSSASPPEILSSARLCCGLASLPCTTPRRIPTIEQSDSSYPCSS